MLTTHRLFDLEERVPLVADPVDSLEVARGYDLSARIAMRFPMERIVSILSPHCKDGTQILNVGSQSGLLSLMLGGRHPEVEVLGVEQNESLAKVAEENMMFATLAKSPARVDFVRAPLSELPVEDGAADIVVSYLPLYRCDDPAKMLRECARVCAPDGLVFIYDLARDADEGAISFVLQYISEGQDLFMQSLRASYTCSEVARMLREAGLDPWRITKESLNLQISSREL